jgi:hypothetical protein
VAVIEPLQPNPAYDYAPSRFGRLVNTFRERVSVTDPLIDVVEDDEVIAPDTDPVPEGDDQ